jgi:UDP-N-acetylmuramyl-tripeptide synthetase
MNIKQIIKDVSVLKMNGSLECLDISGITDDSRNVRQGVLFVAVEGVLQDGHQFIKAAVQGKAAAIILSDEKFLSFIPSQVPVLLVKDAKNALIKITDVFFKMPTQHIHCVGVTGTNGKTTVSFLIRDILLIAGIKCGLIGTIGYKVDDAMQPLRNTTPGIVELRRLMREMIDVGDRYVAMEVSSHALDQDRVAGIDFRSAIFTNLTQDHLDYHKTMEAYFLAKQKLFLEHTNKDSSMIINQDDPYGLRLFNSLKGSKLSYGFSNKSDVSVERFELKKEGSQAILKTPNGILEIKTKLVGRHNLYNILASVAFGISQGIKLDVIAKSIEQTVLIPGRLDRIDSRKGFMVFIDYAHTDDALKNVLESLRVLAHNGRIITVFGCGGDRDKGKRPKMGRVASSLSDVCIITSDNPRSEDPQEIIKQIVAGISSANFEIEADRATAIHKAMLMAEREDIVLIAGKGHETTQIVKDKTFSFSDKAVVLEVLGEMENNV